MKPAFETSFSADGQPVDAVTVSVMADFENPSLKGIIFPQILERTINHEKRPPQNLFAFVL